MTACVLLGGGGGGGGVFFFLSLSCLSALVIHGNGKVQTGVVGGLGFLPFSLLDAFFLESLTALKLKIKLEKCFH